MADIHSLEKLVAAIAGSVLQAQEHVEAAQLSNLMSFFKKKSGQTGYTPLSMEINLPSMAPEAGPGDTRAYRVPYLSMLPYNAMRIKDVEISFDVNLGSLHLALEEGEHENADPGAFATEFPTLSIDLGGVRNTNSLTAHVRLCLESADIPEGTARLINELIKTTQGYAREAEKPPLEDGGES